MSYDEDVIELTKKYLEEFKKAEKTMSLLPPEGNTLFAKETIIWIGYKIKEYEQTIIALGGELE